MNKKIGCEIVIATHKDNILYLKKNSIYIGKINTHPKFFLN
jgi:hypothetical protein